jgi:hypothetical protein
MIVAHFTQSMPLPPRVSPRLDMYAYPMVVPQNGPPIRVVAPTSPPPCKGTPHAASPRVITPGVLRPAPMSQVVVHDPYVVKDMAGDNLFETFEED